jgi:precorrin-6B methylase 2
MSGPIDFNETLEQLSCSAWTYSALATALELGMLEQLAEPVAESAVSERSGVDPEVCADIVEALIAIGVVIRSDGNLIPAPSFQTLLSPSVAKVLRAEIRGDHLQTRSLLRRAREGEPLSGWRLEDPVALAAQGETGGLTGLLVEALLPGLDGLAERMQRPGARILDVGAGVGVVSIELCRLWPGAEAVGLEPHRTARELGRSRIAAAALNQRIALRDESVEMLGELDAYDLAFVPQPFLPTGSLLAGLPRIRAALRPGGWLIMLTSELPEDRPMVAAARRFRARIWGGGVLRSEELEAALWASGFGGVHSEHPIGSFRAITARRAGGRIGREQHRRARRRRRPGAGILGT